MDRYTLGAQGVAEEEAASKEDDSDGEGAVDKSAAEELRVATEAVAAEAAAPAPAPRPAAARPSTMEVRGGVWVKPTDPGFASALRGVARPVGIAVDGYAAAQAAAEAEEVNREAVLESVRSEHEAGGAGAKGESVQVENKNEAGRSRGRFRSLRDEMR